MDVLTAHSRSAQMPHKLAPLLQHPHPAFTLPPMPNPPPTHPHTHATFVQMFNASAGRQRATPPQHLPGFLTLRHIFDAASHFDAIVWTPSTHRHTLTQQRHTRCDSSVCGSDSGYGTPPAQKLGPAEFEIRCSHAGGVQGLDGAFYGRSARSTMPGCSGGAGANRMNNMHRLNATAGNVDACNLRSDHCIRFQAVMASHSARARVVRMITADQRKANDALRR
jgi:hypothetical protein